MAPPVFPAAIQHLPRVQITDDQHQQLRQYARMRARDIVREGPTWARTNVQAAKDHGWTTSMQNPASCLLVKRTAGSRKRSSKTKLDFPSRLTTTSVASTASSSSIPQSMRWFSSAPGVESGVGGISFMAHTQAPTDVDEFADIHYAETTPQYRSAMAMTLGPWYLDAAVMQTLETATPQDPYWYLGIRWAAVKTPLESFVKHRDFVFLEHSGTHVDAQGRRVLYRFVESVHLSDLGVKNSYFSCTRGHLEIASVAWVGEMKRHECIKGLVNPKGKLPLWILERLVVRRLQHRTAQLTQTSTSSPMAQTQFGMPEPVAFQEATEWVADDARYACSVCSKPFNFVLRPRHHCRSCGELICGQCSKFERLIGPSTDRLLRNRSTTAGRHALESPASASLGSPVWEQPMCVQSMKMGRVCRTCVNNSKHDVRTIMSTIGTRAQPRSFHNRPHSASAALMNRRLHDDDFPILADDEIEDEPKKPKKKTRGARAVSEDVHSGGTLSKHASGRSKAASISTWKMSAAYTPVMQDQPMETIANFIEPMRRYSTSPVHRQVSQSSKASSSSLLRSAARDLQSFDSYTSEDQDVKDRQFASMSSSVGPQMGSMSSSVGPQMGSLVSRGSLHSVSSFDPDYLLTLQPEHQPRSYFGDSMLSEDMSEIDTLDSQRSMGLSVQQMIAEDEVGHRASSVATDRRVRPMHSVPQFYKRSGSQSSTGSSSASLPNGSFVSSSSPADNAELGVNPFSLSRAAKSQVAIEDSIADQAYLLQCLMRQQGRMGTFNANS